MTSFKNKPHKSGEFFFIGNYTLHTLHLIINIITSINKLSFKFHPPTSSNFPFTFLARYCVTFLKRNRHFESREWKEECLKVNEFRDAFFDRHYVSLSSIKCIRKLSGGSGRKEVNFCSFSNIFSYKKFGINLRYVSEVQIKFPSILMSFLDFQLTCCKVLKQFIRIALDWQTSMDSIFSMLEFSILKYWYKELRK